MKEWTGERLETFVHGPTKLEHLHRYALAINFSHDRDVLDIACGEGYGSYLLSKVARTVTGVDIDKVSVEKAALKYKAGNLKFSVASILQLPLPSASVDIVACFETIEHIVEHEAALKELKRVLKPSGLLIISTPNKENYSILNNYRNPWHKKELTQPEFRSLVESHFSYITFLDQYYLEASVVMNANRNIGIFFSGSYEEITNGMRKPVSYSIALASGEPLPEIESSLFYDVNTASEKNEVEALKRTITYKTGKFILSPAKFLMSLFKR